MRAFVLLAACATLCGLAAAQLGPAAVAAALAPAPEAEPLSPLAALAAKWRLSEEQADALALLYPQAEPADLEAAVLVSAAAARASAGGSSCRRHLGTRAWTG